MGADRGDDIAETDVARVADEAPIGALVARARLLVAKAAGRRVVLGIAGAPGAGKSTLTRALVDALAANPPAGQGPSWVAELPMDGFHLADAQLDRLGLRAVKGAPETFGAWGYAATVSRVAMARPDEPVYVPGFERELEEPIAAALVVPPPARLVVTEGNYLLLPSDPWPRARAAMAQVWYVEVPDEVRVERLVARHVRFGKSAAQAREWVLRSDEANARLVAATRHTADLVITVP